MNRQTGDDREVVAALTRQPSLTKALIAASFRSAAAAQALREFWQRYAGLAATAATAGPLRGR